MGGSVGLNEGIQVGGSCFGFSFVVRVLDFIWAATGRQCSDAAAFWIVCRGFNVHVGRPASRELQWSTYSIVRASTRSCAACSDRYGPILMCRANRRDQAIETT